MALSDGVGAALGVAELERLTVGAWDALTEAVSDGLCDCDAVMLCVGLAAQASLRP